MEAGSKPQGMLEAGIILGNIQQLYSTNTGGKRNLAYIQEFVGDIAIFNEKIQF